MVDKGKQVLLLPRNGGDGHLHLGQSLGRLGRRYARMLGSLSSRRRRRGSRAFRRLPNRSSRLATFPRWIVGELGSPLRTGGFNLLLLPFAGEDVVASLSLTVGLPLALVVPALASARLPFLSRPLGPVGRRVHLGGRLENNRQDEGQSTYSKKTNAEDKISVGSTKTYLVHLIRVVEWGYPPGSSGVVFVPRDARQPPL